jgi:hypothetical protein
LEVAAQGGTALVQISAAREVSAMTDVQSPIAPRTTHVERRRSTVNAWLVGGLVLALAALIGMGAWFYYDHNQTPSTPTAAPTASAGAATPAVRAMLAIRVAAVNNGDKQTLMNVYAPDAVVEERDQTPAVIYSGNEKIATVLTGYHSMGWTLEQAGPASQQGMFVSEPLIWSGGSGIAVYELNAQGLIAHQWVFGG